MATPLLLLQVVHLTFAVFWLMLVKV
jgi:hypothetical protein